MRLIDADDLKVRIEMERPLTLDNQFLPTLATFEARYIIDHMPTIDAVPVVRCKDCCWYVEYEECDPFCGHKDIYIRPDYFCADGEKVSK